MPQTFEQAVVADFESVADLRAGLEAKARFEPVDLYHRDGSALLGETEARIAQLAGVEESTLLSYNSGMSAVTDAVDIGLHLAQPRANEDETLPVLACSQDTYSQTKRYLEHFLREKRAKVVYFDSGNPDHVNGVLNKHQPDVIVSETIANYLNVPVLDTNNLLDAAGQAPNQPTVVLDNTLPLSTGLPLGEIITEDDRAIVVESGTKSYTFNGALLGIGYTNNEELFHWLRRYRRTRGSLPEPEHLKKIDSLLPAGREDFDDRNRALFRNTGDIALKLASHQTPEHGHFKIAHPAIPDHPNHDFYRQGFPNGGAPVIYIFSHEIDQYEIAERLWDHAGVREQAKLGQSFGFDHARIVADENVQAVRIAGGADTDGEALGEACAEALFRDS